MKLRHAEVDIPDDGTNPFVNCKLKREAYAVALTDIIKNFGDGFVLAVNNEWGTGKTTFIKMWRQQLINQKFKTLYFNAWENDFVDDVLVALIAELKELQDSKTEKTFKAVLEKGATLTKRLAPSLIKSLAKKHLGEGFTTDLVEAVGKVGSEELETQIKKYTSQKSGIKAFRESLKQFASETDGDQPIVFFIDELDRCRPDYAVELLERVKHLFSVPGIVFVLSIDKVQLGYAVQGHYGSEHLNADEYLRRFIDFEYSIPEPNCKEFVNHLYTYHQFDDFFRDDYRESDQELRVEPQNLIAFSELLFTHLDVPLRLQERVFAHTRASLLGMAAHGYTFPTAVILLTYLKLTDDDLYYDIARTLKPVKEVLDIFENLLMPKMVEKENYRLARYTVVIILYLYDRSLISKRRISALYEENGNTIDQSIFNSRLFKEKGKDKLRAWLEHMKTAYDHCSVSMEYITNRIELVR